MSFAAAEADRRISNGLQVGVVTDINAEAVRAKVKIGDISTPMIPVGQYRAGTLSFYWMPEVGEQVLVGAVSGDMAQSVIICSFYAGNAPSADATKPVIDLNGGTMIVNGNLEVSGDVVASGISLVTHTHSGVAPGMSSTGEPE